MYLHIPINVCLYFQYNIPPDVRKLSGNCLARNFEVMDMIPEFFVLFVCFLVSQATCFTLFGKVGESSCKMTHRWSHTLSSPTSYLNFSHIMSTLWYSGFNNRSYFYLNILISRPQFQNRGNHKALASSLPEHLSMGLFFLYFFPRMW